jgi:hypothetical protein
MSKLLKFLGQNYSLASRERNKRKTIVELLWVKARGSNGCHRVYTKLSTLIPKPFFTLFMRVRRGGVGWGGVGWDGVGWGGLG